MKQFHFALGLLWVLSIQMAFAFEVNGVYYTIDREAQNNEVMVTASPNSSYAGKIEIPNEIVRGGKTYMVTSIKMEAFANCQNLNEVVIPASVVSIGEMAFANSNIKTVTFEGGGITVIPYGCFLRCKNLREIQIPQSVESIKRAAFLDCSLLSRVEIPGSVTEIQGNAFSTNETPKNVNWGIMIEIKFGNKPLVNLAL